MVLAIAALLFGTFAVATMQGVPGAVLYIPSAGPIRLSSAWRFGQLLALVAVFSYGICRLALGRLAAAAATLFILTSPGSLYILASSPIRDYIRAPAIYGLMAMLGLYILVATSTRRAALVAGLFGMLIGWGSYYREDLPTFLAPALFTMVCLIPLPWPRWRPRAAAAALVVVGYAMTVPIATARVGVYSINYAAGFMTAMDGQLGLSRPAYDIGSLFLDDHIYSSWEAITRPAAPAEQQASFLPTYMRFFSGDFLTRIAGSAEKIVALPFAHRLAPPGLDRGPAGFGYRARARLASMLAPLAWPFFIAASIALAMAGLRFAFFHVMWLVFVSGVTIAQPWGRNYFYAELFTIWNVAFVLERIVRFRLASSPAARRRGAWWSAGLALTACLGVGTTAVARRYQEGQIASLLDEYSAAATQPSASIPPAIVGVNRTGRLLVADFSGPGCTAGTLWPVIRYDPQRQCGNPADPADWSRSVRVARGAKLFFPAWDGFRGVDLPADEMRCLASVREVVSADRFPLWMTATVPAPSPLAQHLARWEEPLVRWAAPPFPSDAETQQLLTRRGEPLAPADVSLRDASIVTSSDGWIVNGYARPPRDPHWCPSLDRSAATLSAAWGLESNVALLDTDLIETPPKRIPRGAYFVVEGDVKDGGLALGLLRDGESAGRITVETEGPFVAIFRADREGRYSFGVANRLYWYTYPEVRAVVRRARWILPE